MKKLIFLLTLVAITTMSCNAELNAPKLLGKRAYVYDATSTP